MAWKSGEGTRKIRIDVYDDNGSEKLNLSYQFSLSQFHQTPAELIKQRVLEMDIELDTFREEVSNVG